VHFGTYEATAFRSRLARGSGGLEAAPGPRFVSKISHRTMMDGGNASSAFPLWRLYVPLLWRSMRNPDRLRR
jgi:hypothetical protein